MVIVYRMVCYHISSIMINFSMSHYIYNMEHMTDNDLSITYSRLYYSLTNSTSFTC
jgi:hypothetical protein